MKNVNIGRVFFSLLFVTVAIFSASVPDAKPMYNKVYRSNKILDSYHFLLLDNGKYYYVNTNKTDRLTPKEIKSSNILQILNNKQSWGQAFASSGEYMTKNGKIYTKRYLDRIKVLSPKKIKYLNKIFVLQ
jgi:hypothetical protein